AQESRLAAITGTLHSMTANTMVLRADDGLYRLYTFDRSTTKPSTIPIGSQVRVLSYPSGDADFRVAYVVTVLRMGPPPLAAGATPPEPEVVPLEIRN